MRGGSGGGARLPATRGRVVLFVDTFTNHFHPEVGMAATRIVEALGYGVVLVERTGCCGRPSISKGLLDEARELARVNVAALAGYAGDGRGDRRGWSRRAC